MPSSARQEAVSTGLGDLTEDARSSPIQPKPAQIPTKDAISLFHVSVNGIKLREGDSAYVVTSPDFDWTADTLEPCDICGKLPELTGSPLVECGECLRGFHTSCLQEFDHEASARDDLESTNPSVALAC